MATGSSSSCGLPSEGAAGVGRPGPRPGPGTQLAVARRTATWRPCTESDEPLAGGVRTPHCQRPRRPRTIPSPAPTRDPVPVRRRPSRQRVGHRLPDPRADLVRQRGPQGQPRRLGGCPVARLQQRSRQGRHEREGHARDRQAHALQGRQASHPAPACHHDPGHRRRQPRRRTVPRRQPPLLAPRTPAAR